ncbi:hypothetical protein CLOM_g23383 [Closterium sp. NIES-68]|nr:hypothetical protein CLOM_g23383 [Closterium sp. NIES-68]
MQLQSQQQQHPFYIFGRPPAQQQQQQQQHQQPQQFQQQQQQQQQQQPQQPAEFLARLSRGLYGSCSELVAEGAARRPIISFKLYTS